MKGTIINYRGGKRTQYNNKIVIKPEGVSSRTEATRLLGKKVIWITPAKKQMIGKITKVHGKKGSIIADFNPPLPGQCLGTEVTIIV